MRDIIKLRAEFLAIMERARKPKVIKEISDAMSGLMDKMEYVALDLVKKVEFQKGRLAEREDLLRLVKEMSGDGNNAKQKSYAGVVAWKEIIVQGKGGDSIATQAIMEKLIQLEKVRLEKCIPLKEGKVIVKGSTIKDVEIIKESLRDKVDVEVWGVKTTHPKVIISGVPATVADNRLINQKELVGSRDGS